MNLPDITLIFQLAIVLFLMVLLSSVVFKPFLRVLQERKDWVEGAEKKARELQQRSEELMERYRDSMSAAQAQGASIREEIRREGLSKEAEVLQKAMEEANRFLEEMRGQLQEETRNVRAALRLQAQTLSREVAEKMLGRSIQ
ncbi:MAG: ATP synthase F0 subunit B [Syntrophaceae bacterium]|nr:ATP synthase F0 subunit B [Syntrophaceae bacterium]